MIEKNTIDIVLQTYSEIFAIIHLSVAQNIPSWIVLNEDFFVSITKEKNKLSIVYPQLLVPNDMPAEKDWRMLRVKGQLDLTLVGILKCIITPLSEANIPIYTISTYETDYILIPEKQFSAALSLLGKIFIIESIIT